MCGVAFAQTGLVSIAWSADGAYVLFNTTDAPNVLALHDVHSGAHLHSFACNAAYTLGLCLSGDNRLVAASDDRFIHIWDAHTGGHICTLQGHRDEVNQIMFTKDSRSLLSCSCDGTAILWDIATQTPKQVGDDHGCYVSACGLSPNESMVLTGNSNGIIRLWSVLTGACAQTYTGHTRHIRSVCMSPNNQHILRAAPHKGRPASGGRIFARSKEKNAGIAALSRVFLTLAPRKKTFACRETTCAVLP